MLKHQHLFFRKVEFLPNNKANLTPGTEGWILGIGEEDDGELIDFTICLYNDLDSVTGRPEEIKILDEYDLEKKEEYYSRSSIRVRVDEHGAGHIVDKDDE